MDKQASLDRISALLQDPKVQAALLAAGGSGLAGGYLSAQAKRKGETRSERRSRILRNALLAAGGGGLAAGAGMMGYGQLKGALPAEDVDPVSGFGTTLTRLLGAGGAGVVHRGMTAGGKETAAQQIMEALGAKPAQGTTNLGALRAALSADPDFLKGLPADEKLKNYLRDTGIRGESVRSFTGDVPLVDRVEKRLGSMFTGAKGMQEQAKNMPGGDTYVGRAKNLAEQVGGKAKEVGSQAKDKAFSAKDRAKDIRAKDVRALGRATKGMIKRHPAAAIGLGFLTPEIASNVVWPAASRLGNAFTRE